MYKKIMRSEIRSGKHDTGGWAEVIGVTQMTKVEKKLLKAVNFYWKKHGDEYLLTKDIFPDDNPMSYLINMYKDSKKRKFLIEYLANNFLHSDEDVMDHVFGAIAVRTGKAIASTGEVAGSDFTEEFANFYLPDGTVRSKETLINDAAKHYLKRDVIPCHFRDMYFAT